jgi:hypothetical protein
VGKNKGRLSRIKRQRVDVSLFPSLPGRRKKGGQAFCARPASVLAEATSEEVGRSYFKLEWLKKPDDLQALRPEKAFGYFWPAKVTK